MDDLHVDLAGATATNFGQSGSPITPRIQTRDQQPFCRSDLRVGLFEYFRGTEIQAPQRRVRKVDDLASGIGAQVDELIDIEQSLRTIQGNAAFLIHV